MTGLARILVLGAVVLAAQTGLARSQGLSEDAFTALAPVLGQNTGVSADLAGFRTAIETAVTRSFFADPCGDQVSVVGIDLRGQGETALLTANLLLTRTQCISYKQPVCRGFTCKVETRTIREVVYRNIVPVELTVTPKVVPRGDDNTAAAKAQVAFDVTWAPRPEATKQLLGNEAYYQQVAEVVAKAAQTELDAISGQLASFWARSVAENGLDASRIEFQTLANGALGLRLLQRD